MSLIATRKFFDELSSLVGKIVRVDTINKKQYSGRLLCFNPDNLSVCLADARDENGNYFYRVFLTGNVIGQITISEKPFDLAALAKKLEKAFPNMPVKLYEDIGVIVVMDKIRVSSRGVIEGSGVIAERVQKIYEEFVRERSSQ